VLREVFLTQYRRVTDRQTDTQTDGIAIAGTTLAMRKLRRAVKIKKKCKIIKVSLRRDGRIIWKLVKFGQSRRGADRTEVIIFNSDISTGFVWGMFWLYDSSQEPVDIIDQHNMLLVHSDICWLTTHRRDLVAADSSLCNVEISKHLLYSVACLSQTHDPYSKIWHCFIARIGQISNFEWRIRT